MNKRNTEKRQKGYFDLGISVAILALSGLFAYASTPEKEQVANVQEPQIEVVANLEAGTETLDPRQ